MKTIKLLGQAGRIFGRSHRLDVESPAEAIRALCALFPGFRPWVLEQHEAGVGWRVVVQRSYLLEGEAIAAHTSSPEIVFAPVLVGSGGVARIVLGTVLIVGSFFMPAAFLGISSLSIGLFGGALVLGGVAALLTPTPVVTGGSKGIENKTTAVLESNLFTRNQGTSGQGEPVPLLYGQRRVVGPRVVSFDLRNLPKNRNEVVGGTQALLGYVAKEGL